MMKPLLALTLSFLSVACVSNGLFAADLQLREVIVSHKDENGVLQLYRMKEDGSSKIKICM